MALRVTYALTYTVLQVVPKELLLMQTTNATADNVPGYQVIAYDIPGTLPEPYFEDSRVFGPEAVMPHINPEYQMQLGYLKILSQYVNLEVNNYILLPIRLRLERFINEQRRRSALN